MPLEDSRQEDLRRPRPNVSRHAVTPESTAEHRSPTPSAISYYLRYQDNGCFFPPAWMEGETTVQEIQKNEHSSARAENGVKYSV